MRTKEEIIESHKSVERRQSDSRMFGGYDFEYLNKTAAGLAMDEYAKEQSIAFAKWITEGDLKMVLKNDIWSSIKYREQYPTHHLYELFKFDQSQSTNH